MTTNDKIEMTDFSTAGLQGADRFAAWQEGANVVFDVDLHRHGKAEDFFGYAQSVLVDNLMLIHCKLGAHRLARPPQRSARDSIDHFELILFVKGEGEMTFNKRAGAVPTGQWLNLDYGEALLADMTDYETINVFIPRRRLAPFLNAPDNLHGATLASDEGAGGLLKDYLLSLFKAAPDMTRAQAPAAAEALVQLASLVLNGANWDSTDPPGLADNALLLKSQDFIRTNLHNPDLSPDAIADAVGLSRARLYRVFAVCGGVAEYIREMRLRRWFAELVSPRSLHLQVAQIAYGCGFSDPNHFAKLFKARFGAKPSEVRAEGTTVIHGNEPSSFSDADQTYSYWIANLA